MGRSLARPTRLRRRTHTTRVRHDHVRCRHLADVPRDRYHHPDDGPLVHMADRSGAFDLTFEAMKSCCMADDHRLILVLDSTA